MKKTLLLITLAAVLLLAMPAFTAGAEETLAIDIQLSSTSVAIDKNESINASWTISGGQAPYEMYFSWGIKDFGSNETNWIDGGDGGTSTSASFTPHFGETGVFSVYVRDAAGSDLDKVVEFALTGGVRVDPLNISLQLAKDAITFGEAVSANWTVSGGSAPLTVSYYVEIFTNDDAYRPVYVEDTDDTSASYTPAFGILGFFRVQVRDTMGRRLSESKEFTITGAPELEPLALTAKLSSATAAVDKGETLSATWSASGGLPPYTYDYAWQVKSAGDENESYIKGEYNVATTSSTFKPVYGISGTLYVSVRDSTGDTEYLELPFTLTGDTAEPLAVNLTLSADSVAVGKGLTATWEIAGGKPPYSVDFNWIVIDETGDRDYVGYGEGSSIRTDTFYPQFGVKGEFDLTVRDATGRRQGSSKSFTITGVPAADPLALKITLDKTTAAINLGESLTVTSQPSGGTAPYLYSYYWYVKEGAADALLVSDSYGVSASSNSFKPKFGDAGYVRVTLHDSVGRSNSQRLDFTLTGAQAPTEPLSGTLSLSSAQVTAGQPITATWTIKGGTPPYTYSYDWFVRTETSNYNHVGGDYDSEETSNTYVSAFGTSGNFSLHVKDSKGRFIHFDKDFSITDAPEVPTLAVTAALDRTTVDLSQGQTIKGSWQAQGGKPPYTYSHEWSVKEAGKNTADYIQGKWNIIQTESYFMPSYGSVGILKVSAQDSLGLTASDAITFTITGGEPVVSPLALSLSLDKNTVKAGEAIKGTWSASGGKAPYVYTYSWDLFNQLENYYEGDVYRDVVSTTSSTYVPKAGVKGQLRVTATDSEGRRVSKSEEFTITDSATEPEPLGLEVVVKLDKTSVAIGSPIEGSWSVTEGTAPITYRYTWRARPVERDEFYNVQTNKTSASSFAFTPTYGIVGELYVYAEDAAGRTGSKTVPFTITGEATSKPLRISLSVDPVTVDASKGQSITASWAAEGGSGNYTYIITWSLSEFASASTYQDVRFLEQQTKTSDTLTPTYGKRGMVSVIVTDSLGATRYVSLDFYITGTAAAAIPLSAEITLSKDTLNPGEAITATVVPSGGKAPYSFAYEWLHSLEQATTTWVPFHSQPASDKLTSTATVPNAESGQLRLTMTDASGRSVIFQDWFTINKSDAAVKRGDANDDKVVDIMDLVSIIDYIVSNTPCKSMANADANVDGYVDIMDLVWIINAIVGG